MCGGQGTRAKRGRVKIVAKQQPPARAQVPGGQRLQMQMVYTGRGDNPIMPGADSFLRARVDEQENQMAQLEEENLTLREVRNRVVYCGTMLLKSLHLMLPLLVMFQHLVRSIGKFALIVIRFAHAFFSLFAFFPAASLCGRARVEGAATTIGRRRRRRGHCGGVLRRQQRRRGILCATWLASSPPAPIQQHAQGHSQSMMQPLWCCHVLASCCVAQELDVHSMLCGQSVQVWSCALSHCLPWLL